jgi:predicted LPLAT superfamily acyltransferase
MIRQGWLRYRVLMGDPIPAAASRARRGKDDAGLYDAGLNDAMCQAVRFLETTLTTHYDQWMNFFDFWPVASRD